MINSSDEYKAAVVADARRMLIKAIVDIISPDIVYGTTQASSQNKYSKPEQLHDKQFGTSKFATLEQNRWILDGTWDVYPDEPSTVDAQVGFQSEELFGEDGVAERPIWMEITFSNVSILQACAIYFSALPEDGIPVDFTVEVKQGGRTYYTKNITGNTDTRVFLTGFTVYDPDAIRVTVTKWSLPYRRMRAVEIVPGIYEEWDGDTLTSFSVKHQGDVSCLTLPYGVCTLKIDNQSRRFRPLRKEGIFKSIEERQGIDVFLGAKLPDGSVEYKKTGVFYQHSGGWKNDDNSLTIQWNLVDIIGLLVGRAFIPPDPLPTTLEGWITALTAQLGEAFVARHTVDPNYANKALTVRTPSDVTGIDCGELLCHVCMASGTWPRADAETGNLAVEPLWNEGNKITLDNLVSYPIMRENPAVSAVVFTLNDGNETQFVVSGVTDAAETKSVSNPFIKTREEALTAARNIVSVSGGNQIDIVGRGDPASEIGDVDTVWMDESTALTARRVQQLLEFSDGVMHNCSSVLLQADGALTYEHREIITQSGQWTAPKGVERPLLICVGGGDGGHTGTDGTWNNAGADGADGYGAMVWAGTININDGQVFDVTIGRGGDTGQSGTATMFGAYSSANGHVYPYGYTDIVSGQSYARTGVKAPVSGSGDGGQGGRGGSQGQRRRETVQNADGSTTAHMVIDSRPGKASKGRPGADGCVVVCWNKS